MNSLPAAGRALHRDAAAVRLDDPLDEAEAEAGALDLRGDHVGGAIERLEDPRDCSAGAMPMPRSATLMRTSSPVGARVTPIQRPSAPYLMALPIRF